MNSKLQISVYTYLIGRQQQKFGAGIRDYIMATFLALILLSCSNHSEQHDHSDEVASVQYTCPMHPEVISNEPGQCPVCGMDLVKLGNTTSGNGEHLMFTDSQLRLANITTLRISQSAVGQTISVNGRVVVNEELSEAISSRAAGRIEKLYVKETGRIIRKGEPLYQLYSESLLTLQREFLLAKEQFDQLGDSGEKYKAFLDAARKKLILFGLTESQINRLETDRRMQKTITFVAPAGGVVRELEVAEGQYVDEGTSLMRIDNLDDLWVEAELYPDERALVKVGDRVNVRVSGSLDTPVDARVMFLNPEYRANTQIAVMRVSISNKDLRFVPGMHAQVLFSHSSKDALALPVDAVIRDGNGSHVYVQRGRNTFRPVMVKTGIENFDQVEITEGLSEGDTVAVSGAYLLYSEMILKKGSASMGH